MFNCLLNLLQCPTQSPFYYIIKSLPRPIANSNNKMAAIKYRCTMYKAEDWDIDYSLDSSLAEIYNS